MKKDSHMYNPASRRRSYTEGEVTVHRARMPHVDIFCYVFELMLLCWCRRGLVHTYIVSMCMKRCLHLATWYFWSAAYSDLHWQSMHTYAINTVHRARRPHVDIFCYVYQCMLWSWCARSLVHTYIDSPRLRRCPHLAILYSVSVCRICI